MDHAHSTAMDQEVLYSVVTKKDFSVVEHGFAQTNIQLFNQIHKLGFTDDDLILVGKAYEFAMQTCSHLFRPSGKPLLSHFVGTASITAWTGASATEVAAAVLHNVYQLADFGDGPPGITGARRLRIQKIIGRDVEAIIALYHQTRWRHQVIQDFVTRIGTLSDTECSYLLIRAANELEYYLDRSTEYSQQKEHLLQVKGPDQQHSRRLITLTRALGQEALANFLQLAVEGYDQSVVPTVVRRTNHQTFAVVPPSFSLRLARKAQEILLKARSRLSK